MGATVKFVFMEEKEMKKWIWILIAAVLVAALAVGMLAAYWLTRPETTAGEKKITVTVVHGDGSEKTFTYDTDEEYLGAVLVDAGLIQGNDGPYGLEMHTVDGEKADWNENKSYWALYIGEEYALTGVDSTPIADGAVFKLVYTIG